ncbi:L-2-keto-3-deoxyarabonate dehydratase [Bosea sp. 62]|uniref:dihydrodipicolinate synthase family protein n=1 Tax=unclassified Bosea (in: a-proteobacteria) TaxID=2653178 RepID=UPI0012561425|nr:MULTISPECIES: dihydrodipicolinate synthase family protein [unclassified Bosea (in: a-proteobacteria)]CAD5291724.1 L-2-keto-3-deoxyarabonate dehydratase [Bosea sp. 7B]CAD5299522.1 L-2-keto-3-deoxyarabonate dehydratase [Bosea sp. 21B]CAD5299662.1 L-2-keto-3-deoxyarabonate dehydratase [Bosea sp. 46]VVT61705.1 L-2-keto-3-deoxyarabonate dehydratase [Bosea sp. EC-HK365B]VXB04996.1 L-2-keto-3-deoxyarabonate dehydratase [Bosea sp. 127]
MSEPYKGIIPIAPTIFHENGDVDHDGNRRVMDLMVDQGVDGICILANFSEQFLLTDAERDEVMRLSIEQVAGRVPVCVTTSHFSTRIAAQRAKAAADAGAKMLMMMPPYHGALLKADEQGMIEHFKIVADACGIPIILQDAPLSGVSMSVPFMVRLNKEVPLVRYFKIEVLGTAGKLRSLIEAGGDAIVGPFDGEEAITLMADLDAGATGTMTSAMIPDLIKPILAAHAAGDRRQAAALYARVLPIINYENRQCGLRSAKAVMKAGGVIKSDAVRHPLTPLHPQTREGLLELARELDPLALRWGK